MVVAKFADDVQMLAISSDGKVVADLAGASELMITDMVHHSKLTVSIGNLVVAGSRANGATACFKYKRFNNARQASTNNLGVDFATGGQDEPTCSEQAVE